MQFRRASKPVPLIKSEHLAGVFPGEIFIGVVAAVRQHAQLPGRQVAVEHHPLLDVEDRAAIGIQDEKRAGHRRQYGAQVEDIRAVFAAELDELVVKSFGIAGPVPVFQFFLPFGLEHVKTFVKHPAVDFDHGFMAVALGAGHDDAFDFSGMGGSIVHGHHAAFTLTDQVK